MLFSKFSLITLTLNKEQFIPSNNFLAKECNIIKINFETCFSLSATLCAINFIVKLLIKFTGCENNSTKYSKTD